MKILLVSPTLTLPAMRGYEVMIVKHMEILSRHHEVELVTFGDAQGKLANTDGLKRLFKAVYPVPFSKLRALGNLASGIFRSEPFQSLLYKSATMTQAVASLVRAGRYDVVVFQSTRMIQYLPPEGAGATVLHMMDPLVFNFERSLPWRPWYLRPLVRLEASRLRRYEARHAARFGRTLLLAAPDVADYQRLLPDARLQQVPYGIDTEAFKPASGVARVPGSIVMSGNMGYPPNVHAAVYFCQHIFPRVLQSCPDARLTLVGARPAAAVRELHNGQNIFVTGFVDDVRPYIQQAMVSVCSVKLAVGTQTKVLEAMSLETPVVTTSAGNHGIGGVNGKDLHVTDDPEEFAGKIAGLLQGQGWQALSSNGRKYVTENFKWSVSAERFEAVLQEEARRLERTSNE